MVTSSNIQECIVDFLSDNTKHSVQEIKAYLSQCGINDYTEGQFAGSITTLQRNGTIKKYNRGVYSMKPKIEDMKKCFIICPIGDEGSETRDNADKLFKHVIKPVCEKCNFNPIRIDMENDVNSITQGIIDSLDNSELVIADISGHNPNVFYEMGYRTRTKRPMIHLKKKGESIPFDVNTIRTLEYDLTDLDNVEEIKDRLKKTIESFTFSESTEKTAKEDSTEKNTATIMQVLYEILDTMDELKAEVKNFSPETIGAVVKSLQPNQPQMSPDTALQMQLMNGFMQNPEGFMKLVEFSEKFNTKK